ncbi:PAS domain-containing sensor histidine kinase [Seleniivibrio woodruffii]|uniref:Histidine kinase/DNA gyrase B/HSP90-like ATPase n=1 Tax=Seleniivibrio woodruffii TaxID=1078050 RepID=A0A4R1K825_9BACT|nr:PAS domain-containing sensor histidine kinase [Seleniivibrio woodruffii]TCK60445.1 histidine kinase/DNA gyrase B/HSP90-like ATPase [Seleniivibrio woodruffii]TVZ36073.1 histidine kinase/DNA gyrase B/HSP90-like ATPase [Seleniivibrio woodruffii]
MSDYNFNGNISNLLKEKHPLVYSLAETVHEMIFILDSMRRIVFFNKRFAEFAENYHLDTTAGLRPGHIFRCTQVHDGETVCGTTPFCCYCGAYKAITSAATGEERVEECRIKSQNGAAFDLKVSTSKIDIEGSPHMLFCVVDISSEKRKQALEKIFFHDINNLAGGLTLISDLLEGYVYIEDWNSISETVPLLSSAMSNLNNEIKSSYMLALAEKDELDVCVASVDVTGMLTSVAKFLKETTLDKEIDFKVQPECENLIIYTDQNILNRVVTNMTKNAAEASKDFSTVTLSYRTEGEKAYIYVQNETVMEEEVKASIFQRSFSTKGAGRGLGTYSMRLLTERYLKGSINFTSTECCGTVFYIEIPLSLSDR